MSNNCDGVPPDSTTPGTSASTEAYDSSTRALLPDDATVQTSPVFGGDEFGQDLLDRNDLYKGFIADDSIDYQDFEQLFTVPSEVNVRVYKDDTQYQNSLPEIPHSSGINDFYTKSGIRNNEEFNTTNIESQYGSSGAYVDQSQYDHFDKPVPRPSIPSGGRSSSFQQLYRNERQEQLSDENDRIDSRTDIKTGSTSSSEKPQRPILTSFSSSEEHSVTSGTSSRLSHAQSTPNTISASSPPVLKLRRGRPPLYPPLSTYQLRPQIIQPESSGPSDTAPPSPPSTSSTGSSATRPRRGRPRLHNRPPSDPTSSQEITREQNRLAAQRFRARQDTYMATLNAQVEDLELKNKDLKDEVAQLREQRLELRDGMLEHGECGCGVIETYLEGETRRMKKSREDEENT